MSERTESDVREAREQAERQAQMLHTLVLFTTISAATVALLFGAIWLSSALDVARYAVWIAVSVTVGGGTSLWLLRRGWHRWATALYLAVFIGGTFAGIYIIAGVRGPATPALVVIVVTAALLGRSVMLWTVMITVTFYLLMAFLEIGGIIHPIQVTSDILWWTAGGLGVIVMGYGAAITLMLVRQTQQALDAAWQRQKELVEARRRAEQAVLAEQVISEREVHAAEHLRQTVSQYAAFLERVASGEYGVRLETGEPDEDVRGDRELHILGDRINATVGAWVETLREMQEVQRRYVQQSWVDFTRAGQMASRFQYHDGDADWLPEMGQAVQDKVPVFDVQSMALPLVVHQEVIGALGMQRAGGEWNQDDVTLVQSVAEQLSQTIEGLRLLEETRRLAAREQMIEQVSGRIRESLELESVLQAAAVEMQKALGLERLVVRLGMPEQVEAGGGQESEHGG